MHWIVTYIDQSDYSSWCVLSSLNADWLVENINPERTPNGCCLHGQQKLKKDKTNI